MEGGRERDDFYLFIFHCGVARDRGSMVFLKICRRGMGRSLFFFSMLKRDERGIFFYKFTGGVRVGLIN